MARTGAKLLWGTANLFSHPRYAAGAATNPDPEVFAYAAAQVKVMLEATHRLGGANYVLWGGREGYETLLNTDLAREEAQFARFLTLVAEHKHRSASTARCSSSRSRRSRPSTSTTTTARPSTASSSATASRANTGSTSRRTTPPSPATASTTRSPTRVANGIFGSIDANRGDYQNGWDTDQFPNSVDELSLALYEIVRGGGFTTGGFNFDAKLRRQSLDRTDLFHGHIGGIDTLARALLVAAGMIERGAIERFREERYAAWNEGLGASILSGGLSLEALEAQVDAGGIEPQPVSGRQELLENLVNQAIWAVDRPKPAE